MSLRFRRSIRIGCGVRLNFSKSGVSATLSPFRGLSINLGPKGIRQTVGIPGTGLTHSTRITPPGWDSELVPHSEPQPFIAPAPVNRPDQQSRPLESITSAEEVGSAELSDLATEIVETSTKRGRLHLDLVQLDKKLNATQQRLERFQRWSFGGWLFGKTLAGLEATKAECIAEIQRLENDLEATALLATCELDSEASQLFDGVRKAFLKAARSHRVWDQTSSMAIDAVAERSVASAAVTRSQVRLEEAAWNKLENLGPLLKLENANGADLYLSESFLIAEPGHRPFSLIDLLDLEVQAVRRKFVESEQVPNDAEIVGQTWEKVNRDGSPDRRFSNNRQLPIVMYAELMLTSSTGLRECYVFSNHNDGIDFARALVAYTDLLRGRKPPTAERATE